MFWYLILLLFTYQQSAYGTPINGVSPCLHARSRSFNISEPHAEHDNTNAIPNILNSLNIHISFNGNDKSSVELTGPKNKRTFKCPTGYELKEDHCEDVDECELSGNKSLCSENAKCINTVGSYECRCHKGFMRDPSNNKVCVREFSIPTIREENCSCHKRNNGLVVDGCPKYPNAGCEHECESFPGGYRCVCPEGYELMSDGKSCKVSNKCSSVVCDEGFTCANHFYGVFCIDLKCPQHFSLDSEKNTHDTWRTWHRCSRNNLSGGDLDFNNVPKYFYWYELINVASMKTVDANKPFRMMLTGYYNEGMRWSVNSDNLSIKLNGYDTDYIKIEEDDHLITLYLVKPIQGPKVVEFEVTIRESPTVIDTIFYLQVVISEYKFGSMNYD